MTNETTASQPMQELVRDLYNFEGGRHFALRLEKLLDSQPKSIGDDSQFIRLMNDWDDADIDRSDKVFDTLVAYIDSRAPAAQASATIQAAPDDFDAWQKNPYTLALQKSIAQDYVPCSAGSGTHADDIAVDRFAAAMKQRMAEMRSKGRKGWDNPKKCAIAYLMQLLKAVPLSQPVDVGNYAMMLFNRAIWENEGYPDAATNQEPVMDAEPVREPVAVVNDNYSREGYNDEISTLLPVGTKLYAAPMVADPAGVALQELLTAEFECYRPPYPHGLMVWARNALLDTSPHRAATVKAVPSEALDGMRFRWLNEDHDSAEVREQARALAKRLGTSSYFAITRDIDAAMQIAAPLADKTGGGE